MNRSTFLASSATFVAGLSAVPVRAQSQSIGQILRGTPHFSKFVEWAEASGVESRLSGGGPFTVFAPLNSAFGALVPGLEQTLLRRENRGRLLSVVLYHVLPGTIEYSAFKNGTYRTMNGQRLTISNINGIVRVNNFGISETGLPASNGIIYPSSAVLAPPMVQNM